MTADELALRRTVCAHPEDDAPRLVLADWYDEHGQEARGEFIRVQIAHPYQSAPHEIQQRQRYLRRKFCPNGFMIESIPNFGDDFDELPSAYKWSRGFISAITLPTQSFLDHAATLFGREPVQQVTLSDREPQTIVNWFGWGTEPGMIPELELPSDLPRELWKLLDGPWDREDLPDPTYGWKWYAARDLAIADLSAACVRLGRERAGLPPAKKERVTT